MQVDDEKLALAEVRGIYLDAFPPRQRMPIDEIVETAAQGQRLVLVLLSGPRALGFAVVFDLDLPGTGFLEYLAVHADHRNRGLGTLLWQALRQSGWNQLKAVTFEVEDPGEAALSAKEVRERIRRIAFYERLGALFLPVDDYRVPNLDGSGTERMRLMWAPLGEVAQPGGDDLKPGGDDLKELVRAVYLRGYGLSAQDPHLTAALASLA